MNIHQMIAVMQGCADGKIIEFRAIGTEQWRITVNGNEWWDWENHEYRIKPREPMEGYICIEVGVNNFHASLRSARRFADLHPGKYRVVKVREVIE